MAAGGTSTLRTELGPMLGLAAPLVLAELSWMMMGVVDTVMVGHLPNAAVPLSAAALAQITYNTLAFGVGGVLLGLDTVIAQAHGAGRYEEANHWLSQGVLLAGALAVLLLGLFGLAPWAMGRMHLEPAVLAGAVPTLRALSWGTLPLLLMFALRRHLQAFNHVGVLAATQVSANLVNAGFDWLLIFPHRLAAGGHAVAWAGMGVVGSGIATALARLYQAAFVAAALYVLNRRHGYGLLREGWARAARPRLESLQRLLLLGLPAGGTILVEISIFATVTYFVAALGPVPLAGHEIALNCISLTFMVPMGISAAASVRVGQAIGRGNAAEARAAGKAALGLSAGVMLCASVLLLALPHGIAGLFTRDAAVLAAVVPLFAVAAVFQFFDGMQITAIGALRGLGDTHSGLVVHLCSYWLFGLPVGLGLCFRAGLGARGLWMGLCAALVVSGSVLLARWRWRSRRIVFVEEGRPAI